MTNTIVFDLDGTLCETDGEDYMGARPVWRRIRALNALHDAGHHVVIDTARGSGSGIDWTEQTREQLRGWGVQFDVLRCGVKFPAERYIDDRATNVVDWEAAA